MKYLAPVNQAMMIPGLLKIAKKPQNSPDSFKKHIITGTSKGVTDGPV